MASAWLYVVDHLLQGQLLLQQQVFELNNHVVELRDNVFDCCGEGVRHEAVLVARVRAQSVSYADSTLTQRKQLADLSNTA